MDNLSLRSTVSVLKLGIIAPFFIGSLVCGETMNILNGKPTFEVRLSAQDQRYFLNVNGCHIYREFDFEGQMDTEIQVNEYMKSGENQITLTVLPLEVDGDFDSNGRVEAELWVRDHGSERESGYCLGDICFIGANASEETRGTSLSLKSTRLNSNQKFAEDKEGDVKILDLGFKDEVLFSGAFTIRRKMVILSNLPLWKFFESEDLPDYNTFRNENPAQFAEDSESLLREYEKIQAALESGSNEAIDSILPLFDERNQELDLAYYMEPGFMKAQLRQSFLRECNDPDQELVELAPEYVDMIIEENLKLTALNRNGCESAIGFNDNICDSSTDYDIIFRRENGKWIISR